MFTCLLQCYVASRVLVSAKLFTNFKEGGDSVRLAGEILVDRCVGISIHSVA